MKYKVEGGTAEIGSDMVLKLSVEQAAARSYALEKAGEGWRPTRVVQFKAGEEIEIVGLEHGDMPRSLSSLLVPIGKPKGAKKSDAEAARKAAEEEAARKAAEEEAARKAAEAAANSSHG